MKKWHSMTDTSLPADNVTEAQMVAVEPAVVQETLPAVIAKDPTRKHIRGSSLLLLGRIIAMGLNFGVQIVTVRYLAKSDYGALAFALSVVSMATSGVLLGLDKSVARFVPIYQEQRDYNRMVGTVVLAFLAVLALGVVLVAGTFALQNVLIDRVVSDPLSAFLLLSIIALAPIQALDSLFQGLFAVFVKPRAIFFRRHLLGPGLKLAVVLLAVLLRGDVQFIALGYIVGALLGLGIYVIMLMQVLRKEPWFGSLKLRDVHMPAGEVFAFAAPVLGTDILLMFRVNLVVVLLETLKGTTAVADFKAVLPFAGLNLVVYQSFKFLYTPLASRFYQRGNKADINDLYWQTAAWISIISFPVLALTVSLSGPMTVLALGQQYAQSAVLLAILSAGEYFNAAFGYNSYTLQVYGKVAYIMLVGVITAVLSLALNFFLIQQIGALGAAIGTTANLVLYNTLNHVGLIRIGVDLFQWRYLKMYLSIVVGILSLLFVQTVMDPPIYISFISVTLVCLAVFTLNRRLLEIERFFPEVKKIPVLGRLMTY